MVRRKKKSENFLGKLKEKADQMHQKSLDLTKVAAEKAPDISSKISKHGKKSINKGISVAKKMTAFSTPKENLDLLEKLANLKDRGVISKKEFQIKKKDLLGKI